MKTWEVNSFKDLRLSQDTFTLLKGKHRIFTVERNIQWEELIASFREKKYRTLIKEAIKQKAASFNKDN